MNPDPIQQQGQPESVPDERATLTTEPVDRSNSRAWIQTGFDLLVQGPKSPEVERFPVCYSHLTIGNCEHPKSNDLVISEAGMANRQAILKLIEGHIYFNNLNPSFEILCNDEPCTFCQLQPNDRLQFGAHTVTIHQLPKSLAFLEGYSPPHKRQVWPLQEGKTWIGRAGKRNNHIELDDPTVSREHASIVFTDDHFVLTPDSQNELWVNARHVSSMAILKDEDLLQVGGQLLRFRSSAVKEQARALVPGDATILFSDIWNYTALTESRPLEETIGQLNEVYKGLGQVILDHQGHLMTYLGDAMMAVFGSAEERSDNPNIHAELAVRSGLHMLSALRDLNQKWKQRNLPELQLGIGIATGEVMMGDVGVTGHREFAAMGDTTNVASRIEKLTREQGIHLLINGETASRVKGTFPLVGLGAFELRGRRKPVEIFQVMEG